MHAQARQFITEQVQGRTFGSVIEIGGRFINGGIVDLVRTKRYLSMDIYDGAGVDVVADARDWTPEHLVDLVICCEVLEHAPAPEEIAANAMTWLVPGGTFLMTCATDPRAPHCGQDGGVVRDGEYYRNVPADIITAAIKPFGDIDICVVDSDHGDLRVAATRR